MKIEYGPEFKKSMKRMIFRERFAFLIPKEYYRKIKYLIQRCKNGYSDQDLWNTNDHIAKVVSAFLDHTEECKMSGYPASLTEKKWNHYKKEIRWLMEQQLEGWDVPVEVLRSDNYQKRYNAAQKIFGQYWNALWD